MLPLLLIAADAPTLSGPQAAIDGAVAAERAFALDAQDGGQWAAFLANAASDALLFAPQAKPAAEALRDAPEPAIPVMWWSGTLFPACDGTLAIDTGPWTRAGPGTVGSFTTVWRRQADGGWKWQLDHGRETPAPIAAGNAPQVHAPDCASADPPGAPAREAAFGETMARVADDPETGGTSAMFDALIASDMLLQRDGQMPAYGVQALPSANYGDRIAFGHDSLWSLAWESYATATGGHDLRVWQWRGPEQGWRLALYDLAEPQQP